MMIFSKLSMIFPNFPNFPNFPSFPNFPNFSAGEKDKTVELVWETYYPEDEKKVEQNRDESWKVIDDK